MTETMNAPARNGSGEANGRIRGARAADWSRIREPQCTPAYHADFEKAPVGSKKGLLDAGCCVRMVSRLAANLGAEVSGMDASAALFEIARERLPDARLELGDLEQLAFDDNAFHVVTGFNSFQYATDPVAAAAGEGGPFALSEPGKLEALAEAAGLTPLETFDVSALWSQPDLETAQRGLGSSGVAVKAAETRGQKALDATHAAALAPFRQSDGSYCIGATFRVRMAQVDG